MITQELKDYISEEQKLGKSREEIEKTLLSEGWKEQEISEAFGFTKDHIGSKSNFFLYLINRKLLLLIFVSLTLIFMGLYAVASYSTHNNTRKIPDYLTHTPPSPTISTVVITKVIETPKLNNTESGNCGIENFVVNLSGKATGSHPKLECFIDNSRTCTTSSLEMINSIDASGIKITSTISYKISKENTRCRLDINQGDITYSLPVGVPEDLLKPILEPIEKLENTSGVCIFSDNNELVKIFERLSNGDFSMYVANSINGQTKQTELYIKGSCSGSYFDAIK